MTDRPRYDLLLPHGGDVAKLAAAVQADPDHRRAVEAEIALLEARNARGQRIVDRCAVSREYAARLRQALGMPEVEYL